MSIILVALAAVQTNHFATENLMSKPPPTIHPKAVISGCLHAMVACMHHPAAYLVAVEKPIQ
jgi:hypothetical protein